MGTEVRRGPSLLVTAVPILIIFLLLHAHICRAAVWPPPAGGNSSASGGGGGWLVGDIAGEDEFSMDSEINRRMLQGTNPHVTDNTKNRRVPAVACDQGRSTRYTGCLPPRGNGPAPARNPRCGLRNRECKP